MTLQQRLGTAAAALAVMAGGCAHIADLTPVQTPTGSPSPGSSASASPSPVPSSTGVQGECNNTSSDPSTTLIVSISPDFPAASTPYGDVFGYAAYNPQGTATAPPAAQAIAAKTGAVLQFVNIDANPITHSAVAFPGATSFPAQPYSFPANALTPAGSSITSAFWSTGGLASFGFQVTTECYSQTFSLGQTGTYFFGDDPLYNSLSSFRGVLVVTP